MRIVMATFPCEGAEDFAEELLRYDLARCVQVQRGATSIYRWGGRIHRDEESILMIKAAEDKLPDLRRRFLEMHPYEVPEFLPLVVEENGANPAYLDWIRKP